MSRYIVNNSDGSRTVWLGGEMEFPWGITALEAYDRCAYIAEQCGYIVGWRYGRSAFSVCGGDINGYIVLDWFDTQRPGPVKIERWTSQDEYIEAPSTAPSAAT
jgi:hypothetical protein